MDPDVFERTIAPFTDGLLSPGTSAATPMMPGEETPPRIDHFLSPPAEGHPVEEPEIHDPENIQSIPQVPGVAELEVLPPAPANSNRST